MAVSRPRRVYNRTNEYTRIEGDAVLQVVETIQKVVPLADFMTACKAVGEVITPIFPNGTRYYHRKDNKTILVLEQPSQTRTITWVKMDPDEDKTRWKLAFPYIVYVFSITEPAIINNCRMFYRAKPITSLTDMLYRTNLGNIYSDTFKVCTGYSNSGMRAVGTTMAEKVESYIAAFWHSEFNIDLPDQWGAYARGGRYPQFTSLEAWQKATAEDSLFPLSVSWLELYTLERLVKELITSPYGDA